jgi:hypothetical protein
VGRAHFRFYAELNDFLPPERRFAGFIQAFDVPATVKHWIESCGVPHTEVELVLVNGESEDFTRLVRDGDRVSVYPVFESVDVTPLVRVRPAPLRDLRFVLDTHLGKLARNLRLLGFDCLYGRDWEDSLLAEVSAREGRVLLTRDRGLLMRGAVTRGCYVRETAPRRQALEVLRRFDLAGTLAPLSRCLRCNDRLESVGKSEVEPELPARTAALFVDYRRCPFCGRVYWQGSHWRRMTKWVEELRREAGG